MGQIIYTKVSFALFIAFLALMISHPIHAQVGICTTSPDASAGLDIQNQSEINQLKSELISLKTLVEKHLNQTAKK